MTSIESKNLNESSTENDLSILKKEIVEKKETVYTKESFKKEVLRRYPRLNCLRSQLNFDWYSDMNIIAPWMKQISSLPNTTLEKIKEGGADIYISDRSVTRRSQNRNLTGSPRGRPAGSSRDMCGGLYRQKKNEVYVGRSKTRDGRYYYKDNCILHELGHMFDHRYDSKRLARLGLLSLVSPITAVTDGILTSSEPSQTGTFKKFHKQFYNKLESYYQQGGPGGEVGCKEFFAEATYQFFSRGGSKFSRYYSNDLYNYMKAILVG